MTPCFLSCHPEQCQGKAAGLPGAKGKVLKDKSKNVLKKNASLETMQRVVKILEGEDSSLPDGMEPNDVTELKYCPITSVDLERSFSAFKLLFSDRRHNFTEENMSKVMISNCFYARKQ